MRAPGDCELEFRELEFTVPDASTLTDEKILQRLLAQSETQDIASSLGMEPEAYARRVLHYIRHPDQEPMLELMSEADATAAGMPSVEACRDFLAEAVEELQAREQAHFAGADAEEAGSVALVGGARPTRAPKAGTGAPTVSPAGPASGLSGRGPRRGIPSS